MAIRSVSSPATLAHRVPHRMVKVVKGARPKGAKAPQPTLPITPIFAPAATPGPPAAPSGATSPLQRPATRLSVVAEDAMRILFAVVCLLVVARIVRQFVYDARPGS